MPSSLTLLLLPLLLLFHTGPVLGAGASSRPTPSTVVSKVTAASAVASNAALSSAVEPIELELPECEFADLSAPAPPAGCFPALDAAPEPVAPVDVNGQAVAPMCDVTGASIVAVPDVPEIDRGHFEQLPCDARRLLSLLRINVRETGASLTEPSDSAPRPSPAVNPLGERFEGAWAYPMALPTRDRATIVAFASGHGLERRRGHGSRVYRPPSPRC
jgi:hypothetical protein